MPPDDADDGTATPTVVDRPESAIPTVTTAADALHGEEIERTRMFIRSGWVISVGAMLLMPLLPSPRPMQIAMVAAMLFGMAGSFVIHQRFADPRNYSPASLFQLGIMCVINAHVAVLYFGTFTMAPVTVVIGAYFVGRTEVLQLGKTTVGFACACYGAIAALIITRAIDDPGVFSTDLPLSATTQTIGAGFVIGSYVLGYHTGRVFRAASLLAIDELARATRTSSQREALMAELRADLERALQIGGPGRYTGQTIGELELGVVIGRGAMGEVYEARQLTSGAPAAIKLLRRELLSDPTAVARFMREARATAALDSPHIVRILGCSQEQAAVQYLAMERLHGATLAEILRRETRLSSDAVCDLANQAGIGIDAARAAGIVHRDLKPQNLFRTDDGIWKLLDFGAATLGDASGTLTQGGVIGTPHYMAPEQAQGKPVDGRADLYALAAVAYRCLTGRHPFTGTDTPALLYAVVHEMPTRPSLLAELPSDVDACLAIALAKDPADRFASAAELARMLAAALAGGLAPAERRRAAALVRRLPWKDQV